MEAGQPDRGQGSRPKAAAVPDEQCQAGGAEEQGCAPEFVPAAALLALDGFKSPGTDGGPGRRSEPVPAADPKAERNQ